MEKLMEKTYPSYRAYKQARQKNANALPLFFAFSNEQFKEEMEKRGLTVHDTDKIYRFGDTGGFYLRKDAPIIRAYLGRPDELPTLMENPDFAEDAFYDEMCNHEYGINWQGDWDVCNCFGSPEYEEGKSGEEYLKDMGYSDTVIAAYKKVRRRYNLDAMEHDWF